jgi:hypothetical protein
MWALDTWWYKRRSVHSYRRNDGGLAWNIVRAKPYVHAQGIQSSINETAENELPQTLQAAEKSISRSSMTAAAKADEHRALIAALKRCATQNQA